MSPPSQDQALPRLVVDNPDRIRGRVYVLAHEPLLVGRDSACQIQVVDPWLSRRHAVVWRAGGQTTVEDLSSTNGTRLNGHRVLGQQLLRSGDILDFGPLAVHYEEPPGSAVAEWRTGTSAPEAMTVVTADGVFPPQHDHAAGPEPPPPKAAQPVPAFEVTAPEEVAEDEAAQGEAVPDVATPEAAAAQDAPREQPPGALEPPEEAAAASAPPEVVAAGNDAAREVAADDAVRAAVLAETAPQETAREDGTDRPAAEPAVAEPVAEQAVDRAGPAPAEPPEAGPLATEPRTDVLPVAAAQPAVAEVIAPREATPREEEPEQPRFTPALEPRAEPRGGPGPGPTDPLPPDPPPPDGPQLNAPQLNTPQPEAPRADAPQAAAERRFDVARQQAAGNLSNIGGNQYNYVMQDSYLLLARREEFFRRIAATRTKARHLALVGVLLATVGGAFLGWTRSTPDVLGPDLGGVPVNTVGMSVVTTGVVLLLLGVALLIRTVVRQRRYETEEERGLNPDPPLPT